MVTWPLFGTLQVFCVLPNIWPQTLQTSKRHTFRVSAFHRYWFGAKLYVYFSLCAGQSKSTLDASRLKITRNSAIADKPARRIYGSVKITKHSTITYSFLLCNSNFVFKTRRFYDIRLQKCRELEIRVRGHLRSLKVVSIYRFGVVSY